MIKINERIFPYENEITLFQLRDRYKPNADLLIYNGFPVQDDRQIQDGDELIFIKRGEVPSKAELEALMVARHTPGVHQKVKTACVGVAGVGGLGSAVAIALARLGIGKLVIADFDVVEPSNLNRQQYFVHQIGKPKVEAIRDNLNMINPYVQIEDHNIKLDASNINQIFKNVDVLVEAFDTAFMKSLIVDVFLSENPTKFLVCASGLAGSGDGNTIKKKKMGNNLIIIGDLLSSAEPGRGLMAPRVGIAAHHQANAVLEILLGEIK